MNFRIDVCIECGQPAFPPRLVCPVCGSTNWEEKEECRGTAEAVTSTVKGIQVASVRSAAGPVVIARSSRLMLPGTEVELSLEDGAPVATPVDRLAPGE